MEPDLPFADQVERLVFDCLERFEQDGDAAVDAACRAHPEHATAIRASLVRLAAMGLVDGVRGEQVLPERLGDFRLIRRLGQGGMGVVYLAEQESLRRQVALKVVRPDLLFFAGSRQRFRREVEAVARLSHPGIVPVYSVGEAQGIPYFAMELVDGRSLVDVLGELRARRPEDLTGRDLSGALTGSWVETCLRLVRQVAEALAHAHARGVLHRDVKPSNILVGADGRARLVDFGIAMTQGATRLTQSGAQPGSLPYMAPEQLSGLSVDARTDVYALGVTLYELLTLRAPFQADTTEEMRRHILAGTVAPPRAHSAAIPADVETACLTAMDPDPKRRYATMAALAADLGNLLALRPIAARPAGAWLRTRRFVQRHPTASTAVLLGFLLVVVAPSVAYLRIAGEITRTLGAKRDADAQRDKAHDEARTAQLVLDLLLGMFRGADPRNGLPKEMTVRALVRTQADWVLRQAGERPAVRAAVLLALGETLTSLGLHEQAGALLPEALRLLRAQHPTGHVDVARCLYRAAELQAMRLEFELAEASLREALDVSQRFAGEASELAASCHAALGGVFRNSRRLDEAEPHLKRAVEIRTALHGEDSPQVADTLAVLGDLALLRGEARRAERIFREALRRYRKAESPVQRHVALALHKLAGALTVQEEFADAEACSREAVDLYRAVLGPDHPDLCSALYQLALLRRAAGEMEEALATAREALAMAERVLPVEHVARVDGCLLVGELLALRGDLAAAEPLLAQSWELAHRWHAALPAGLADVAEMLCAYHHERGEQDKEREWRGRLAAMRR